MASTRVLWVDRITNEATLRTVAEIPGLLGDGSGWLWLDIPEPDDTTADLLTSVFGLHPVAVRDVLDRNHVPRMHVYGGTLFLVLHRPEAGDLGHVHYLEIDQVVSSHYLITTHGPRNPAVPLERLLEETGEIRQEDACRHVPACVAGGSVVPPRVDVDAGRGEVRQHSGPRRRPAGAASDGSRRRLRPARLP